METKLDTTLDTELVAEEVRMSGRWCLRVACVLMTATCGFGQGEESKRNRLAAVLKSDPSAALRLAKVDGKYHMLLRQIRVEEPGEDLIIDRGFREKATYRGHKNLPNGHWVYARPYWFIWRDSGPRKLGKRRWGPEQITGKPDGTAGQDVETAWATKLQDNKVTEWIMVEYESPIKATAIRIHETFNPGAISKVSIFKHDGEEVVVWRAKQIVPLRVKSRVLVIQPPLGFQVGRIKVYLETSKIKGWNEIDAIGLVDDKKQEHWARSAVASSTFASGARNAAPPVVAGRGIRPMPVAFPALQPVPRPVVAKPVPRGRRGDGADRTAAMMERLLAEMKSLKAENRELKMRLTKLEKVVQSKPRNDR